MKNVLGDLNQERIKYALVPLLENVADFSVLKTKTSLQDIIRLLY